jgi:hypothetical protein
MSPQDVGLDQECGTQQSYAYMNGDGPGFDRWPQKIRIQGFHEEEDSGHNREDYAKFSISMTLHSAMFSVLKSDCKQKSLPSVVQGYENPFSAHTWSGYVI